MVAKKYVQQLRETIHDKTKWKQTFFGWLGSCCLFREKVRCSRLQTLVVEIFCTVDELWTKVRNNVLTIYAYCQIIVKSEIW